MILRIICFICILLTAIDAYIRYYYGSWLTASLDAKRISTLYEKAYDAAQELHDNLYISNANAPRQMQLDIREWHKPVLTALERLVVDLNTVGYPDITYHKMVALCPRKSTRTHTAIMIIDKIQVCFHAVIICMLPSRYIAGYLVLFILLRTVGIIIDQMNTNMWVHFAKDIVTISAYSYIIYMSLHNLL